jgi:hypothetical protein
MSACFFILINTITIKIKQLEHQEKLSAGWTHQLKQPSSCRCANDISLLTTNVGTVPFFTACPAC